MGWSKGLHLKTDWFGRLNGRLFAVSSFELVFPGRLKSVSNHIFVDFYCVRQYIQDKIGALCPWNQIVIWLRLLKLVNGCCQGWPVHVWELSSFDFWHKTYLSVKGSHVSSLLLLLGGWDFRCHSCKLFRKLCAWYLCTCCLIRVGLTHRRAVNCCWSSGMSGKC